MILVVAVLLLPVLIFGTTFGVPGGDCSAYHACTQAHCCPHAESVAHEHGKCAGHEHSHHCHERILLMHEQVRRSECGSFVAVKEPAPCCWCYSSALERQVFVAELVYLPPLYGGFSTPRRC